jgi:hypothetical protein
MRGARLTSLLLAIVAIVVFGYALANVTMRLQRHIAAANQWQHDRRALMVAYAGVANAASASDNLAYGLLRAIAWNETVALHNDSLAMRSDGNTQRLEFVTAAQRCLPNSLAGFDAQTQVARDACRQLVAGTP